MHGWTFEAICNVGEYIGKAKVLFKFARAAMIATILVGCAAVAWLVFNFSMDGLFVWGFAVGICGFTWGRGAEYANELFHRASRASSDLNKGVLEWELEERLHATKGEGWEDREMLELHDVKAYVAAFELHNPKRHYPKPMPTAPGESMKRVAITLSGVAGGIAAIFLLFVLLHKVFK